MWGFLEVRGAASHSFEEFEGLIGFSLQILDKQLLENDALVQPRDIRVPRAQRLIGRV